MSIDKIASVELPETGRYKFVLVDVTDGERTKQVLVAGPGSYHREVAENYRNSLPSGIRLSRINGGGRVELREGSIYAFGESIGYGMAPQDQVESLLRTYVSEEKPETSIKVEMGVGY